MTSKSVGVTGCAVLSLYLHFNGFFVVKKEEGYTSYSDFFIGLNLFILLRSDVWIYLLQLLNKEL